MKLFKLSTWLMAVVFSFAGLQKVQADTVAKIGETSYETIQAAVAEAVDGQTIEMTGDVMNLDVQIVVPYGKTLTLDLNGKTISGTPAVESMNTKNMKLRSVIRVEGGLTIKDSVGGGVVENTAGEPISGLLKTVYPAAIGVDGEIPDPVGSVVINGGSFKGASAFYVALGTVTVNDCSVDAVVGADSDSGTLVIAGGSFDVDDAVVDTGSAGTIQITGGRFKIGQDGCVINEDWPDEVAISGGIFSAEPDADHVAAGYAVVDNADEETKDVYPWAIGVAPPPELKGSGTAADPWQIWTLADLKTFRDNVNANGKYCKGFVSVFADIDLGGEEWTPIGSGGSNGNAAFYGTFDGQNHVISNLKIDSTASNVGLFGYTGYSERGGTIKNLTIENAEVKGASSVAALAGYFHVMTLIENVHVIGTVKIQATGADAGGLVGKTAATPVIKNCSVVATPESGAYIKAKTSGGSASAGGMIGFAGGEGWTCEIRDCFVANVDLTSYNRIGGIAGSLQRPSGYGTVDMYVTGCKVSNVTVTVTGPTNATLSNRHDAQAGLIVGCPAGSGSRNKHHYSDNTYAGTCRVTASSGATDIIPTQLYGLWALGYSRASDIGQTWGAAETGDADIVPEVTIGGADYRTFLKSYKEAGATGSSKDDPFLLHTDVGYTLLAHDRIYVKADGNIFYPRTDLGREIRSVDCGDGVTLYYVAPEGGVCKIGDRIYETLADAFREAKPTDTVVLTDDATMPADAGVSPVCKIDMASFVLSVPDDPAYDGKVVDSANAAQLLGYVVENGVRAYSHEANQDFKNSGDEKGWDGSWGVYNIYLNGYAAVIEAQSPDAPAENIKITYQKDGVTHVALYNKVNYPARVFSGWKYPKANFGVDSSTQELTVTVKSGKIEGIRASSKVTSKPTAATVDGVLPLSTVNIEGGEVGSVVASWNFNQSIDTFNVNVSGGKVGAIYGNGQTDRQSAFNHKNVDGSIYVPVVGEANIVITGGEVETVYGGGYGNMNPKSTDPQGPWTMETRVANITVSDGKVGAIYGGGRCGAYGDFDKVVVDEANIAISGGTIGTVTTAGCGTLCEVTEGTASITGGTFATDPTEYVAAGYEAVANGTDPETWTVQEAVSASVAEVISADGTVTNGFETLEAAIKAVTDGGTVRLLQDLSLDAGLLITADKGAVTVDLNGKTLTGADETYAIRVTNAGRLTVLNGVIQLGIGWDNWAWGVDNRGGVVDVIGVEFKGAGEDYFGDYVTANWDWDYVEQEYNSDWDDYVVVALKEGARFGVTTLRDCTIGYYGPEYECYSYQEFGDQCTRLVIEGGTYECMLGSNMYTPAELCGLEIRGGTFKSNDGFWYEPVCYADITGGEVRFVGDGVFDGCLVTGGTVCLEGGTINLDGISDGTFVGPGTVQMDGPNTVSGGTFSREIYEAKSVNAGRYGDFEDMPALGCWFVENPDGSCTVQRVGTVKVSIRSSNTGCGTIGVSKYKIGKTTWKKSTYGSPATSVDNVEATKGGTITFTATAAPKEDYHFKGWFDNAAGDGQAISVEAELTDFKYTVQDDVTIYAVFELESIYAERVAAAQAWYDGGIAAGALTIGSVDEWRAFTDAVNLNVVSLAGKTVTLTADLDFTGLEYEPVGTEAFGFGGTFDGGEHTIRGARIEAARKSGYVGIFGFATGTIKNLNAADCSLYGGYCAGVIVGEGYRVSNCHVTGSTVGEEAYFGGGVIGHSYNLTLEDVSFEDGTVTNGWKVGAIVGYGDYVDIRNAVVRGNDISESAAGLIYHANADYASFWNIKVDQRQVPLIGTTYGVAESIAFNADETVDTEVWATEIVRMPSDVVTSFALNSGIFNLVSEQAVADAKALVPDPRLLEEGTVVIRQIPVVAAVAEVISADGTVTNGFETLDAAIEAAQDGETVRLLADAELEEPILIEKSIVLDGNGCVLTGSALNTSGTDRATITVDGEVEVVVKDLTVDRNSTVFDVAGTAVNLTLSGVTGYAFRQGVNLVDGYAGTLTLDDTRLLALADGATYITPNCGKQLESLYSKLTDLDAVSPNEGKMEYDHYTFVYGGGVGIRGTVSGAKIALENGSEVKGWWEAVLVEGSGAKVTVAGSEVVGYNGIEISAADSSLTMSNSLVRGVGDELASGFGCALAAFAPGVTFALSSSTVATYRSAWGRTHANYPSAIYTELNAFADKGLVLRDVRFVHEDGYAHTQVLRYYDGTTETRYADKVRITSEISTFTTEPDAGLPLCVAPSYALAYDLNTDKCPDGAKMPEDAPQSYTPEGCVLPKPDYVSTEVTFGGWLIDGTDTAIMAIPAGTTGGLTLKAKWDALARETFEVKVAESVEKRDDPQLTDILLTQAWVDNPSNVDPKKYSAAQSEEEKVAIVQEALNTEAANGNLKWQNYVLGLPDNDPKAQVEAGAEQSPSGEVVQVESKLVVPPVDTGYKVVYALDKVEKDAATGEEIGSRSETKQVLIPVDQVLKDDTKVGYAKLKAVLVPESGEGKESVVPAENTIGIMKVVSDLEKTIIPVPWGELGGGEIRVSNLIQVSNLTPGDRLYVYDIEEGKSYDASKFRSWELTKAFAWQKIATAALDENGQQTDDAGKESDDVVVYRGQGVWLERQNTTKPIILSGQYNKTEGAETTEVEQGTVSAPVHNILATPLAEEIDLDVAVGDAGKDTIFVPTKGAPRVYSVVDGKWGYSEDVVLGNGKKIPVRKVGGKLPASSGFWYVSRGGKDGKGAEIKWDAKAAE